MDKYGPAARLLLGGAGLLLVFGGCSDKSSPPVGPAASNSTTTPLVVGPTIVSDTTATPTIATPLPPGATPAPVDGAALLQQAVAATGSGYHFNETAMVNGAVALTVDGDRLTDGARLAVRNDSGLVFYVITPDGSWLMPENGEWEADDSDPPSVDPIAALGAPTSVTVAGNDGTTVQLVVTVPVAALGLEGDGETPLQVSVVNGVLAGLTYSTTASDGTAASATVLFSPVLDPSPVVAPI